jgi:hypothetical protein
VTCRGGFAESAPTPSSIPSVTGRVSHRIAEATRQALSLEGLVIALIGSGVWLTASAILTQVTKFGTAASVVVGAGVGLVVAAGFIWLVVMPKRAHEQERTGVLRHSARKHLLALAEEGSRKWVGVTLINPEGSGGRAEWQRTVYLFLLDAFGRQTARVRGREAPP